MFRTFAFILLPANKALVGPEQGIILKPSQKMDCIRLKLIIECNLLFLGQPPPTDIY